MVVLYFKKKKRIFYVERNLKLPTYLGFKLLCFKINHFKTIEYYIKLATSNSWLVYWCTKLPAIFLDYLFSIQWDFCCIYVCWSVEHIYESRFLTCNSQDIQSILLSALPFINQSYNSTKQIIVPLFYKEGKWGR